MKPQSKLFTCTLILAIIVSTLFLAENVCAQTFTPSNPEFTVKFVDTWYTIPAVYKNDPYTGEQVIAQHSREVENKSICVSIKNQPFTSETLENGNQTQLYYNVMWKPHYDDYWHTYFNYANKLDIYPQTNGEYTEVAILRDWDIPTKGQIDVKIQVLVGYIRYSHDPDMGNYHMLLDMAGAYDYCLFVGKEYNGTVMQTLTLPEGTVSSCTIPTLIDTPSTTPAPISTPYTTPTYNNPQASNTPANNLVANNASDAFFLGDFKLGIGEVVVLTSVFAVLGSLLTLGLTRKKQKQID